MGAGYSIRYMLIYLPEDIYKSHSNSKIRIMKYNINAVQRRATFIQSLTNKIDN